MTNEEMTVKITETESRSRSNAKRLDKLEERQDNLDRLVTSVALLAKSQESMEKDLQEVKCDVKTLAGKPGKRWEAIVEKAILVIVSAVVAFVLARIGI